MLTWKQSLLTVRIIRYTQAVRWNTDILHVTANGTYKHQCASNDHDTDRERKQNANTGPPPPPSPSIFTVTHALSLTCNFFLSAVGTVSSWPISNLRLCNAMVFYFLVRWCGNWTAVLPVMGSCLCHGLGSCLFFVLRCTDASNWSACRNIKSVPLPHTFLVHSKLFLQ
jgi:hypothetical protein